MGIQVGRRVRSVSEATVGDGHLHLHRYNIYDFKIRELQIERLYMLV